MTKTKMIFQIILYIFTEKGRNFVNNNIHWKEILNLFFRYGVQGNHIVIDKEICQCNSYLWNWNE